MENEELNDVYAQRYIRKLLSRSVVNPAGLILFSGVPGSGKSTLAKRLTRDLNAQYIENDEIRRMLKNDGLDPKKFVIGNISKHIIDNIKKDQNKLIVLDASIDRVWSGFLSTLKTENIDPIIIRLNVFDSTIKTRLERRGGDREASLQQAAIFKKDFTTCKQNVPASLELSEDYDYMDVLSFIKSKISE